MYVYFRAHLNDLMPVYFYGEMDYIFRTPISKWITYNLLIYTICLRNYCIVPTKFVQFSWIQCQVFRLIWICRFIKLAFLLVTVPLISKFAFNPIIFPIRYKSFWHVPPFWNISNFKIIMMKKIKTEMSTDKYLQL